MATITVCVLFTLIILVQARSNLQATAHKTRRSNSSDIFTATKTSSTGACPQHERLALISFKNTVKDDSGMLSSWVGDDCCGWEGVLCDGIAGNVVSLQLQGGHHGNLVSNELSESLMELRYIKYLDLSRNNFGVSIPQFIGSLTQLTHLNLSFSNFSGIIPDDIGNLSSLKELHLGSNNFEGQLPKTMKNLTSLKFLDLSGFGLSRPWNLQNFLKMIPTLVELHLSGCSLDETLVSFDHYYDMTHLNIQRLDLSRNIFVDRFPSILANITSLRVLDLSSCLLSSPIPLMPNLLELDLSHNNFKQLEHVGIRRWCHLKKLILSTAITLDFTDSIPSQPECSEYALERLDLKLGGAIPEFVASMKNLKELCLWGKVTGHIPKWLGSLRLLEVLDLSDNKLVGPIPPLPSLLTKLDLSRNQLNGSIPDHIRRLFSLQVLDLSGNKLVGPIPTFLGNLTKLDLSFNQLHGSIPASLGSLSSLDYLSLESNWLMGPIPSSLGRLLSIEKLVLSSNMLSGNIPVPFGQLAKLYFLDISSNSFEGVISETHFFNLSMLKYFNASFNYKLTFDVSREWLPPFQLNTVDISSCKFANGFPQWFQNQRQLRTLLLSNATISGHLPTWLRNMPIIPIMDLSHNNLSGPLTNLPSVGNFNGDLYPALILHNNLFNESLPRLLCMRADLLYLDLSRNALTGKIPSCVENMQSLRVMNLNFNGLTGVIPGSIGQISSLAWLNLNGNNLSGEIPHEIWNLSYLTVLDLGNNKLCGKLPGWIGENLNWLSILILRKNNFSGGIPRSVCTCVNLHILDIGLNNFTEAIPSCLGMLGGMINSLDHSGLATFHTFGGGVVQVIKGMSLEYTKTLQFVINMDLSNNKLVGEIPEELTELHSLVGLNLSNNHLSGGIPNNIGKMKGLSSLDLSKNELSGLIPSSITTLNFLSHLNLSYNNLSGRIPKGNQLQTLTDPSAYAGNKDLWGAPLTFSDHEDPISTPKSEYEASDELNKVLVYLSIAFGFGTGYFGVLVVFVMKKQWRRKLFVGADQCFQCFQVGSVGPVVRT